MGNQGRLLRSHCGMPKAVRKLVWLQGSLCLKLCKLVSSLYRDNTFTTNLFYSHFQRIYPFNTNSLLILSILGLCAGCTSTPKKIVHYFSHPEYGTVVLPNEHYSDFESRCKTNVYQNGVLVDGQQTQDIARIDAYLKEANVWYIKKMYQIRSANRAAAIGHAAGLRSAGIKMPVILSSGYGTESPEIPDKYHDVLRASREVRQCMEAFGWNREKSEVVKK